LGTINGGLGGVYALSGGNFSLDNSGGGTIDGGVGAGVGALSINNLSINNSAGNISGDFAGIVALSGNNIDINNTNGGSISSLNGAGIFAGGLDDVTINGTGGTITSGGPGILAFAGGTANVTTGAITSTNGSGAVAVSFTDSSTVTVDGKISADNGTFGAAAIAFGGAATVNVNAEIDPPAVGAFALNFGAADATVNANANISADVVGALAVNALGSGNAIVNVTSGADITAGDGGFLAVGAGAVDIFGSGDATVNVGSGSTITANNATVGIGIAAAKLFGDGDVNVNVAQGASVNGETFAVAAFGGSILSDNNVNIINAGTLTSNSASGFLAAPTIFATTDGNINVTNQGTGVIGVAGADSDLIIGALSYGAAGNNIVVNNDGIMHGRVALVSGGGNTINNDGRWNTSGFNLIGLGTDDTINNTGRINTDGLTLFAFDGGDDAVNNTGRINVNGVTTFAGLNNFNNAGGRLDMIDGVSNDVTFISPFSGGNFNGGAGSRLDIDADLNGASGFGPADLLVVGGDITGSTGVVVNDTLAGSPGTFNPDGIIFATYGGTSSGDAFFSQNGPIDKGLFSYDVFHDAANQDWVLASTPDATFFELPSIVTGAQQLWHDTTGVWLDRTADLRSALGQNCSGGLKDEICTSNQITPGAWLKLVGSTAERSQEEQSFELFGRTLSYDIGYQQNSFGIIGGVDFGHTYDDNSAWVVGVLGGYVGSDLEFDNSTTRVDYSAGVVGAYATYLQGGFFADAKIVAQFGDVDYRSSAPNLLADDSSSFSSVGGVIDLGYRIPVHGETFIEPGASVSYVSTDINSIELFGHTAEFDGESLRGRLGVRLGTTLVGEGAKFEPFIGVSAWQEFADDNTASIQSGGVNLTATDSIEGTIGEASIGLNIFDLGGSGMSGFVKGNAQFGDNDYEAYSGNAGVRLQF
jgi:hypothetical protein